jgi:hypothetical protein
MDKLNQGLAIYVGAPGLLQTVTAVGFTTSATKY